MKPHLICICKDCGRIGINHAKEYAVGEFDLRWRRCDGWNLDSNPIWRE